MKELPLYEQKPDEDLWFSYFPESRTVYVNFRGYKSINENAKGLFDFVDRNATERLIIDLRDNGGGNYFKGRSHLIAPLKKHPAIIKHGSLFVLTGRRTMSAAVVNAIDLRKQLSAILVGEPTGGKPNNYGERRQLQLPNSGLTVHYSVDYYKFQDEETPAVMPDKLVEVTWAEYKAGRDAALQWALSYSVNK